MTPDHRRIQELDARIRQKERENGIVKKALYGIPVALLVQDSLKR
jgi:hypothetical protein